MHQICPSKPRRMQCHRKLCRRADANDINEGKAAVLNQSHAGKLVADNCAGKKEKKDEIEELSPTDGLGRSFL